MNRVFVVCVVLAGLAGCSNTPPVNNPEIATAHEVLKTGLDAWKDGKSPASLESGANPVQFRDPDWQAGAKLLEYRIVKVGEEEGETVCTVHLNVEVRGKAGEKSANYRVTLTPKRTVARSSPKG